MIEMHLAKFKFMTKVVNSGLAPFLIQPLIFGEDKRPYIDLNNQSLLISFVGLNEFVKAHMGYELHESWDAHNFGMKIVLHMIDYCKKMSEETGLTFSVWRQPAESTAGKFAQDDYKKFKDKAIIQGNPELNAGYYSNFTHLNVNAPVSLAEKIRHESPFHGLSPSNLLHIWMGEDQPDTGSLWSLTKKIITNSLTTYFAFTREISVCNVCNTTQSGVVEKCKCGAGAEQIVVLSRITGYYGTVGTAASIINYRNGKMKQGLNAAHWQPSKFAEFHERKPNLCGNRFVKV